MNTDPIQTDDADQEQAANAGQAKLALQETDEPKTWDVGQFPVIGIGASAGGLEAIENFFDHVPVDTGYAFIIVQHLSPDFKSLMDELLARHTKIAIHKVEDGMGLEPNAIYLIPPKKNMALSGGRLLLTDQDSSGGLNLPIDILFRSMAFDAGSRCVAVVLSGTGSDGSRGLQDVANGGGLVVVQDSDSAAFDGMPRNAIATGLADVVVPPDRMPGEITRYLQAPEDYTRGTDEPADIEQEGDLNRLFRLFRNRFNIDFNAYKPATIHRRIERRMALTSCLSLKHYVDRLVDDEDELVALYRDLLVEVTHFFRDREAYKVLREQVIPELVDAREDGDLLRVWTAGCATGEEAYSIAILFHDCILKKKRNLDVKVFATDVHMRSLETASLGTYSAEAISRVPDDLVEQCFSQHGSLFHVTQDIRKSVIFAPHDLTKDPPFTKLDLLVCRNVLIYFEPEVQQRILATFHFGLKVNGIMWLGPSESTRPFETELATVDQHWKFFRKLRDIRLRDTVGMTLSAPIAAPVRTQVAALATRTQGNSNWVVPKAFEELLAKYVPPSLLVNEHFELEHSFGEASSSFLTQPAGRPTLEVLKMIDGDLRMALSAALHRALRQDSSVIYRGVRVGDKQIKLTVEPFQKTGKKLFLVSLETIKPSKDLEPAEDTKFDFHGESAERITDLERELSYTKESLQSTVEELETSNEELQATNEELVASNEELQSTNEELHSVNEELYTVNAEHQRKIDELTELTSDIDNLLKGTEIGTIFIDRDLCIRKFTPSIATAFNVLEQDVGRPIDHISYNLDNPELMDDVEIVINGGSNVERKVRSRDGRPYFQRITPYRLADGEIAGAILTFTDVSAIEQASREAERRAQELERTNNELVEFAYAVSHDLQSPLRHIVEHGNLIREQVHDQLDPHSLRSLNVVTEGAQQLSSMIESLLTYSRVHTRGEEPTPTDCNLLLDEVKQSMAELILETGAEIDNNKLPIVSADGKQLKLVFWHLIKNAILYCRDQSPRITIDARKLTGEWQFSFEDNGMGIEPRCFDRIFVIFQRLYRDQEIPGDGVGLALSKRIVERHGGRIWLASRPGRGSTFYITLPTDTLNAPSPLTKVPQIGDTPPLGPLPPRG